MQLARHNSVQLIQVPGHDSIVGNETADQLARMGSEHPFVGPEPACSISIGVAKKVAGDWVNRNYKKYWESITGFKQAKGLIPGSSAKRNGSVEIKHRPVKMGGRAIYRTLSPK
jgi:hypothetical protein